jgi:hypothetical protein
VDVTMVTEAAAVFPWEEPPVSITLFSGKLTVKVLAVGLFGLNSIV